MAVAGFVNVVGAMPPDRSRLGNQMCREMKGRVEANGGGFMGIVEADDFDVNIFRKDPDWWIFHRPGKYVDGVALVGTKNVCRGLDFDLQMAAPRSSVNDPRPILTAQVDMVDPRFKHNLDVCVFHSPKPNGGLRAARQMDDAVREFNPDVFMCDSNTRRSVMHGRFPRYELRGEQVVWIAAKGGVARLGAVKPIDVIKHTNADDHPGLLAPILPVLGKAHKP